MEMLSITSVTYMDIIKLAPNFVSLDISVNSTGWACWYHGDLTKGTYTIKAGSDDDLGRRKEFKEFLRNLIGDKEFEYIFIEDVIGGVNFKTNKALYQLNPIADDMIADGVLKINKVVRENNGTWKKNLKKCAGYTSNVRSEKDDKQMVREALFLLDFGDKTTKTIAEDVYDAIGMAVGIIFNKFVLEDKGSRPKLKTNVEKGYKIKQFFDLYQALDEANELGGAIHQVDFTSIKKDLKFNFKKMIETLEDDKKMFVITIPTNKIGALALDKGLDLDSEMSYLVIYRSK